MATIASCKIFPSIGIARLGDSAEEYFIGPEAPGFPPDPKQGFKDPEGRIKRQAARFRIYGYDQTGEVIQELNESTPGLSITWSVRLANRKASWFTFQGVKRGEETDKGVNPTELRNKAVTDRSALEITPGLRSISGASKSGPKYHFDDGVFLDIPVALGELRTDEAGRLLVFGGYGVSGHTPEAHPISNYANNDYWYDDTSDGPVSAIVKLNGTEVPVKGAAWVIVAPPKFAPGLLNVVTLYEVLEAAAGIQVPSKLSFRKHIYPLFARMADNQWVNAMALRGHGPQKRANFRDPAIIGLISDNSKAQQPYRQDIFARIRNPRLKSPNQANYYFMPVTKGTQRSESQIGGCISSKTNTRY
jgi:hypothetical protein